MFRKLAAIAAIGLAFASPAFAQSSSASETLHRFFAEEWERSLRESPESASYRGDKRYNDRWTDDSLAAIQARQAADRDALAKLRTIDRGALSAQDRLSYDVMAWQLERAVERQKFNEWQRPLNQRGGVQTLEEIAEVLPFASTQDYRDWLKRMAAVPTVVEQATALMREGLKAKNTPPKVLMQRIPAQIGSQVVDDPVKSPFFKPFAKFPDAVPASERAALQAEAKKIIAEHIVPAYRKFDEFFSREYLPGSRESIAAADLPDGREYYDFLAAQFTTTDLSANQIHEIGLKEVARIRGEMEKVKSEVGFQGTLTQFFDHLRTDPKFFYKSPEELFTAYQAISKRIDPELVKISKMIPRLPYGVRPLPDNLAPDTTTA